MAMDERDRAVGSNPTSSAKPLNRLQSLFRRSSPAVLVSNADSKTWKVSCFLSLLLFVVHTTCCAAVWRVSTKEQDVAELKQDMKVVRAATTDTSHQVHDLERRVSRLEAT